MRKRTQRAIDQNNNLVLNDLRAQTAKLGAEVASQAGAAIEGLRLNHVLNRIVEELLPKAEADIRSYDLSVGVRDPKEIADSIQQVVEHLASLGGALVRTHWTGAPGNGQRMIQEFEATVTAYGHGVLARTNVAVEKQRHGDPPLYDHLYKSLKNNWLGVAAIVVMALLGFLGRDWIWSTLKERLLQTKEPSSLVGTDGGASPSTREK